MATNINKSTEIAGAWNYPENRLNQRERKVLEVGNQYDAASAADWGGTAPASLDAALDTLAASNSGGALKSLSVTYDFSVNGGAISSINLGATLPDNAIVVEVIRDELTACTSGGSNGTIILSLPTDGNLEQTALTADGGSPSLASSGGTALPKKTTAARAIQATIATSALTAGKIQYFIRYYQGQ
jgi:hypothetical protein